MKKEQNEHVIFTSLSPASHKLSRKIIFGKYQIIKLIWKGPFSSVYIGKYLSEKNMLQLKTKIKMKI